MEKHFKKSIAPVIVSLCLILYYAIVAAFLIKAGTSPVVKIIVVIVSVIISIVIIAVMIERLKEIKIGEEDDLSKY